MLLPKCLCVQSFFPKVGTLCCSASIKFSGMPQRPKPPLKDDSAMDVVKPESCDQKFEKANKLSKCCRYKIRAFEDVSAIQMWLHSPGSLRGIVIHDFAVVSRIFMEAASVDSIQLQVTIHSSQTYNFHHGVFGPFPWKINHLYQGIHQKRTGESLRVNYKKNVSKPILVWLHPIQTTKKWLWVGSSNGKISSCNLPPKVPIHRVAPSCTSLMASWAEATTWAVENTHLLKSSPSLVKLVQVLRIL